jgi:hypothetical protein
MDKFNGGVPTTPQDDTRIDELVDDFRVIRDWLDREEKRHQTKIAPYIARREALRGEMLAFLDRTGQKSARTAKGTVEIRIDRSASCSDPDALIKFIRESGLLELLDRRPNKTACFTYAQEHDGEAPPGVKLDSTRNINVRKPTS